MGDHLCDKSGEIISLLFNSSLPMVYDIVVQCKRNAILRRQNHFNYKQVSK